MAQGDRFMAKGTSKLKWTPTLTDSTSPYSVTRTEITNSVDLTADISDISGMSFQNDPVATPDLASTFETSIPGSDTAQAPVITFYERDDTAANHTIQTALAKGNSGYLLAFRYGDVVGRELEIWKVTSTGVNRQWTAANEAAKYVVTFAVTAIPTLNATVPA